MKVERCEAKKEGKYVESSDVYGLFEEWMGVLNLEGKHYLVLLLCEP